MKGKQVYFESRGKTVLDSFEVNLPQEHEVAVEIDYSVISAGTERANLLCLPNTASAEHGFPHYPGYSAAGRVCAKGEQVRNLQVGDRVIVPWGGHRSHTVLEETRALKIEDDKIDLLDAAFAQIVSFPFLGVRKLRLEIGESAMIAGLGLLGMFAVQIANLSGAIPVLAADPDPKRRELALELGATAAFDPSAKDFISQVMAATGGKGVNAVVEVTGNASALQQALEYVAWEGRISLLGCTRISDAPIDFYKYVHRRGIHLIGAHTMTRPGVESRPGEWTSHDDFRTFLKFLAAGKIRTRPVISEIVQPEQVPEVFTKIAETANPPLGFVIDWRKTHG
ncbi:MAG: Alcohol dehydrogenase [Lentisphaerae bacterium ADurb.Bin242]|nr:MAG: Alcohol dehydrogenase [Lentisphaerae bacterium ADurb.Bin242]